VTGWLVDSGDPDVLADGIRTVAADAELRTRLATNARQYAIDTFDISAMLGTYQALYLQLLNQR
jgi:glycosyltransferase involved in cell wall biosynthesis